MRLYKCVIIICSLNAKRRPCDRVKSHKKIYYERLSICRLFMCLWHTFGHKWFEFILCSFRPFFSLNFYCSAFFRCVLLLQFALFFIYTICLAGTHQWHNEQIYATTNKNIEKYSLFLSWQHFEVSALKSGYVDFKSTI